LAKLGIKTQPNSEVELYFEYKNWVNWVFKKLNSPFGVVDVLRACQPSLLKLALLPHPIQANN